MDFYTNVKVIKGAIYIRGHNDDGRYNTKNKIRPYLFIDSVESDSEYKTIHGHPVTKKEFSNPWDAKAFMDQYKDIDGVNVHGMTNYEYPYINDVWTGVMDYDMDRVRRGSIDIEVDTDDNGFPFPENAEFPITAITLGFRGKYIVIGCKEFDNNKLPDDFEVDPDNIQYIKCACELELLSTFIKLWKRLDLDIITGWNIDGFDIPYIINRLAMLFGPDKSKELSPWGIINTRTVRDAYGGENILYEICGITSADYLNLYKKFRFKKRESYALDFIGQVELGRGKVDYGEYRSISDLYKRNHQKYIEYNIVDTWLIDALDEKLNFMAQLITIAYDAKVNFSDVFGTVRMWDVIIHNYLMDRNIVVPKISAPHRIPYPGGFVKEPIPGMYKWVVSFDLTSLYPSIIMQYNMSPETLCGKLEATIDDVLYERLDQDYHDHLKEENAGITCNGVLWKNDEKGVFPTIVKKMFDERVMYKKKMLEAKNALKDNDTKENRNLVSKYNNMQMARKIQLNSLYGCTGNVFFRFFDLRYASGITTTGQMIIRWAEKHMNEYINGLLKTDNVDYIIAVDTDSVVGSTIINVNGKDISIEDFYDIVGGEYIRNDSFNDDYVKKATNEYITPSVSKKGELEYKPIKYIMKHKVNKKLYKISCNGNHVTVTEDHSVIVRDKITDEIIDIKPCELDSKIHDIININVPTVDTDRHVYDKNKIAQDPEKI